MSQWYHRERGGWVETNTSPGVAHLLPLLVLGAGLLVTVVGLLAGLVGADREWLRVDACLDAGGRFDYERSTCDHGALGGGEP